MAGLVEGFKLLLHIVRVLGVTGLAPIIDYCSKFSRKGRALKRHWRVRLHDIVFENDTPAGRAFDIVLLVSILLSVFAVLLESVSSIRQAYGGLLRAIEWTFTILFTVEYLLR